MLNDATGFKRAFIKVGYTDLRRGIDGLAAMIQQEFQMDPFEEGTMFMFCGRRTDRIKVLTYEGLSAHFCYPKHFVQNCTIARLSH